MARRQVPQVPQAIQAAQEAVTAAEQRRSALEGQYDDALAEAIQREQRRTSGPGVYVQAAVIIEDERVALLRKQLQSTKNTRKPTTGPAVQPTTKPRS